jgi:5-methylcytosine-specific restriction endonuclease McrA
MSPEYFTAHKLYLRAMACQLRREGVRNRDIGNRLSMSKEQFRDLFKPARRKFRNKKQVRIRTIIKRVYPKRSDEKPKPRLSKRLSGPKDIPSCFWILHRRINSFQQGVVEGRFNYCDVIAKFGLVPSCYLTGEKIDYSDGQTYELDHFVPRCKGGSSKLDNLRLCTRISNRVKNGLSFDEFIQLCAKITAIHHI